MNYDFRKDQDTPIFFKARLRRAIRRSTDLTIQQKSDLLKEMDDEDFVTAVLDKTCQESMFIPLYEGGLIDWLKSLDWLRIIQIALMIFMLFLDVPGSQSNESEGDPISA